ncbi:hypothetical protein RHMOL_Rhmol13G0144000 [Rhododendron molle]|uniref:Uncharacterized protein n=1 Tax=Rhododendron molle TaxID=49168 RepID=A0ACC0L808_RHOML|nr:hypothetical protein RHMOL_Rhmol13G0144000 [Rhododendron molle]
MHLTKGAFSNVPVWVKLYNVPLESWTKDGLRYIASYIVWKAKETIRPKVPVVKERIATKRVGQVVPVVQEQAAKERVDGDKDEWVEVKRKKAKRTPLAISSSFCVSSTVNKLGVLERCEDLGASAVVKLTNKDDARTVPPLVVLYPVSCVSTPIVQGRGRNQQELPPVALHRSTCFREPPRIPLEDDSLDLVRA